MVAATKGSVLITGCSDNGIGSGLALAFQRQGYHVFATARNLAKVTALKDLPNVTLLQLDVTSASDIKAAAATVSTHTGGTLDYLVNNAGRNHFMPFLDEDIEACKRIYDTNVWGPLAVTQALAPLVIKAKGHVTFITSISGYVNVPYMGTYAGSKRAIEIMAETLRLELGPFGVKVLSVVTGAVATNGQTYFDDFALPAGSRYQPVEDTVATRARGGDGVARMSLADYARRVVAEITSGATGKFWCGNNAGGVKFGTSWLPQSLMDSGVAKGTGLDVLAKREM